MARGDASLGAANGSKGTYHPLLFVRSSVLMLLGMDQTFSSNKREIQQNMHHQNDSSEHLRIRRHSTGLVNCLLLCGVNKWPIRDLTSSPLGRSNVNLIETYLMIQLTFGINDANPIPAQPCFLDHSFNMNTTEILCRSSMISQLWFDELPKTKTKIGEIK